MQEGTLSDLKRSFGDAPAMLCARALSKRFGGLVAVQDVSFDIAPGSVVALIGPNGAGKSTLFNLITGVDRPDTGQLWLQGDEITRRPPHRRNAAGLARTFQIVSIFPGMSVLDNVLVGAQGHLRAGLLSQALQWPAARVEQRELMERACGILEEFGLLSWANSPATALSYGNQRRVEVARALMADPDLVLLDEPTAGLSGAAAEMVAQSLLRLQTSGKTVFIIEHNMKVVMSLAERILVMDHGVLIADGAPAEIQANPEVQKAYLG